jgi:hypothetical protein
MTWRVGLFRLLVCTLSAAFGMLAWLMYLQTNSHALQQRVVEQIRQDFPQVDVQIGSAWLRPLGGLWLQDIRVFRRDEPSHPFLLIPSATVYHDKEQLASGKLAIRKVELTEPVVHLRRSADGKWNLPDWPKPPNVSQPVPILVVRRGRILLEDRRGGQALPVLELTRVQLNVVNDPVDRISLQGAGQSPLGEIQWSGIYERTAQTAQISMHVPQFQLVRENIELLSAHVDAVRRHLHGVRGQGAGEITLTYTSSPTPRWHTDLRFRFQRGQIQHPQLPWKSLEHVEFTARYQNGQLSIDSGQARTGPTRLTFHLHAIVPWDQPPPDDLEECLTKCHLSINQLALSNELFERLPDNIKQIHADFSPVGPIGLTVKLERQARWWSRRVIVEPDGIAAEFVDFPYRLEQIRGKLEQTTTSEGVDELRVSLVGMSDGKPIRIEGTASGTGRLKRLDLRIHGQGQQFDDNLRRAMGRYATVLEKFHPEGTGDFVALVHREPGDLHTTFDVQIELANIKVRHDQFPLPLQNVTGTVRIRLGEEDFIRLEQIHGMHRGGEVAVQGTYRVRPNGDVLVAQVRAAALPIDSELLQALRRVGLSEVVSELHPSGRCGLVADFHYTERSDLATSRTPLQGWEISCHRFTVETLIPGFLPYELSQVEGTFYYHQDTMTLKMFRAQHGESRISIGSFEQPSVVKLKPQGGIWARLNHIQVVPLVVDEDLLRALPPSLRMACTVLEPRGPMVLQIGTLIVDTTADPGTSPDLVATKSDTPQVRLSAASLPSRPTTWIYWRDFTVRFSGASCRLGLRCENVHGQVTLRGEYRQGRLGAVDGNVLLNQVYYHGQPLRDFHAQLVVDPGKRPGVIQVRHVKARAFNGSLAGEAAVVIDPIFRYDVRLNGWGIQLEEVSRHNRVGPGAELAGRGEFHLFLTGTDGSVKSLRGGGYIRVPKGRIYNLPPLVDLLKFIKFQAPDGTFFHEFLAHFRINATRVEVEQFDLVGNLVSLTGNGEMNIDGSQLRLDIYPVWLKFVQMLPPAVREIPQSISRSLYKIEMTGSLTERIDLRSEAVPILVEPVRRLAERMRQGGREMVRP